MPEHGSLPSYEHLFGEPSRNTGDEARSVYSPAAYLADLLQLLDDRFEGASLLESRQQIKDIPLDAANTLTEIPYLDIVNEVLAGRLSAELGKDAYTAMTGLPAPFAMPFSLDDVRRRTYLRLAGVAPERLYRRFATDADPDVVAREYLGLSQEALELVTTPAVDADSVKASYGIEGADFSQLTPVDRFLTATGLTAPELAELLLGHLSATATDAATDPATDDPGESERTLASAFFINQGPPVTVNVEVDALIWGDDPEFEPWQWLERVNRFVRLAHAVGMPFTELDQVLRTLCGNVLNREALRTLAVVRYLASTLELPLDVVCGLVAPMDTVGIGNGDVPEDLFDRTFNGRWADVEATVLRGSAFVPKAYRGHRVLTCTGDLLAPAHTEFRRRVVRALGMSETDVTAVVQQFRRHYQALEETGPFDGDELDLQGLSLLHRIARLTSSLSLAPDDLFAVLDALAGDPSIRGHNTFDVLIDAAPGEWDCYRILASGSVADGLWLVQTLVSVVRWMQATDLDGAELHAILGGTPDEPAQAAERLAAAVTVLDEVYQQMQAVLLAPAVFVSDRFDERSARVVHEVLTADGVCVSAHDKRLVRVDDPDTAASAAYACLLRLPMIEDRDFVGLGLAEHVQQKIFTNLVLRGYVQADGVIIESRLPQSEDGFALAGNFDADGETVFELIGGLCQEADGDDVAVVPSDLESLETLSPDEQAELYDNLIFNRYLDTDGTVLWTDFFLDPENAADFWVNADLGTAGPAVWRHLQERVVAFDTTPVPLDTAIFDDLRLPADDLDRLVENLRFNGYLDASGGYVDKRALLALRADQFNLAAEFFPHRQVILDAVQAQLDARRSTISTTSPEDLADVADQSLAARILAGLEGTYLLDGRVPDDDEVRVRFQDGGPLGLWLDLDAPAEATICGRVAAVLAAQQAYHLDRAALADLDLDDADVNLLVGVLTLAGDVAADLAVPYDRLAYFRDPRHALDYTVEGFEDYSTDVFWLLHDAATELAAGTAEITERLEEHAETQRQTFLAALQDGLGIPADTVEAICRALCGDVPDALDDVMAPVLAAGDGAGRVEAEPADRRFRRLYRRLARFALLATKLRLTGEETEVAFRDQDLVGKFAEPLALPAGITRVDALLPSGDGHVYVFDGASCWRYAAGTFERQDREAVPLGTLSERFAGVARVDAAFVDADGAEWLVGHDRSGRPCEFRREAGTSRWVATPRTWGLIKNNFADPERIDTAFRDAEGKTYLFSGDQYVRYSGDDYAQVDEGYPRKIAGNWAAEGLQGALPPGFETSVDASFQGLDGRAYLFAGGQYAASGDAATRPVSERWGRVRNAFLDAGRIDAAYAEDSALYLLLGDQVVRYVDCIENGGVQVDEGYPRRLEQHFPDVPVEFETGIEAAFAPPGGGVQLFKDGRTVTPGDRVVRRVDRRWAQLGPVLPTGTVDAAFVGLDGKTYLFNGDRYVRYSGAGYSHVDAGYPRLIARDWGGMTSVDVAFVLDGRTQLFGTAGTLFRIPVADDFAWSAHERHLGAGDVPPEVQERLLAHGLQIAAEGRVEGQTPEWTVPVQGGGHVTVRREVDGMTVSAGTATGQFCVRYSGRSYAEPDPGYPRRVTDDRWNLPDAPAFDHVDAVFTGRDERTYAFAGDWFATFDNRERWWSEPKRLARDWDSLPFDRVDAAFVGNDGKTYVFGGPKYVRYSGDDYTRVDDRYPKTITDYWGAVVNAITRTGHVDAGLVVRSPAEVVGGPERLHTYLFSGGQYVRYEGTGYANVDDGYPRDITTSLRTEPRLANLTVPFERIDAAVADRRTVYLFSGNRCHAVSTDLYRAYDDVGLSRAGCAFLEDGAVLVEDEAGWRRFSALEGDVVEKTSVQPRILRAVPESFRTGLDAVLDGVDGNTYLFKGRSYYDVRLGREFATAEDWGRPRNTITDGAGVDAAFAGRDGKTYVFSGDQFLTYPRSAYADAEVEGYPRLVQEHWGDLTAVALAYVRDGITHLFEPPDASGNRRYVRYSGSDHTRPDPGYPQTVGPDFWGIPADYQGAEPLVAVLFDRDNTLYLTASQYIAHNAVSGVWSYPRPLARLWAGLPMGTAANPLRSAFTGADGATYFFSHDQFTRFADGAFSPPEPVQRRWGRIHNAITSESRATAVDAAFVWRGTTTYLFSGDQYVRYSGSGYRYADAGYPKSVLTDLRSEECFRNLPEAFVQTLDDRIAAGEQTVIDAVLANDRTVYLFVGASLHVASHSLEASYELGRFGRVRNTLADTGRVDASFVRGENTFLFSGDQYVRYTGGEYGYVDEGYPLRIAASLPGELGLTVLPEQFQDGLDAALADAKGQVYLFRGRQFVSDVEPAPAPQPIVGIWGRVRNLFVSDPYDAGIDAAFVSGEGSLFAFKGDQYLRYRTPAAELADDGYPRTIKDDWGNLPPDFEKNGLDAAFVFEGNTYFVQGDQHVRYSGGDFRRIDRTYPQPLVRRFGRWADYLLTDLRAIARFKQLQDGHDGLAMVLGSEVVTADPYGRLAGMFGWDVDELMWVQRHHGFLPGAAGYEVAFDIELVEAAIELFALAAPLGGRPSTLFADVWTPLYDPDATNVRAAADGLLRLLALQHPEAEWATIERRLHDELNVVTRDALVAAVLGQSGDLSTSRDLFDRFYIDVDMGSAATTSRVREAIAAAQVFFHRYLLDLQPVTLRPGVDGPADPEAVKAELRRWWDWMKNYRLWEANRKVYLYPENYIRPELRDTKTPAFAAFEDDLLQGEITQASAERAYRRYLDEYTEVSRLTIAGGYVHEVEDDDDLPWHLVLFGRTKTDPRRYYYRLAEFSPEASRSAEWHPWLKVNVQIDSDRVYPVHAFDRVFVFWPTIEHVADPTPTVSFSDTTDSGTRSLSGGSQTTHVVKIYYSFYNLNEEWVPAQVLTAEYPIQDTRPISDVRLLVERSQASADSAGDGDGFGPDEGRETIVVRCSYTVQGDTSTTRETRALQLSPELYTKPAVPFSFDDTGADRFTSIFDEDVARNGSLPALTSGASLPVPAGNVPAMVAAPDVVTFNTAAESTQAPWFSFDYKGGSFLCKTAPQPRMDEELLPVSGGQERLPDWERFDAVFTSPDRKSWFFNAAQYVEVGPGAAPGGPLAVAARFGRPRNALTENGVVDAVLHRDPYTYVFSGAQYFRYSGSPLGVPDDGYPKLIQSNADGLPRWPRVAVAFTSPGGTSYFVSREPNAFVSSAAMGDLRPLPGNWGSPPPPPAEDDKAAQKVHVTARDQAPESALEKLQAQAQGKPLKNDDAKGGAAAPVGFFDHRALDAVVVRDGYTYMISEDQYIRFSGEDYRVTDQEYPKDLATNTEGLPRSSQVRVGSDGRYDYVFDNAAKTYTRSDGSSAAFPIAELGRGSFGTEGIAAACLHGKELFLVSGMQFVRYTLPGQSVPDFVDAGYPKTCSLHVDALVQLGGQLYVFSGDRYGRLGTAQELDAAVELKPIEGNWGNLPYRFRAGLDAAGSTTDALYLFSGDRYVRYPRTAPRGVRVVMPYELRSAQYEIIRLTTGTAVTLNRRLLAGGVAAVLDTSTQETDETPAFDTRRSASTVIRVRPDRVDEAELPVGSHLDFDSANGIYYWEAFFHAPLLIANALNTGQQFAEAMQWYEFIFDPRLTRDPWRFLPFRAVDVDALLDTCSGAFGVLRGALDGGAPSQRLTGLLDSVRVLGPVFAQEREAGDDEAAVLHDDLPQLVHDLTDYVTGASAGLAGRTGGTDAQTALRSLQEALVDIRGLGHRYDLIVGGLAAAVRRYLDDPFDPHAIASVRPGAYRRAVVMAYIDNLLDWGDMLFRQYTGESIDEARLLYVLALDLLGERPRRLGLRPMRDAEYYGQLKQEPGEYDMLLRWAGATPVHASAAPAGDDAYFFVPENTQLTDYWTRVEDRLNKIRQSQDILGVARAVPLFAPPIEPAALVAAIASGADVTRAAAGAAPVEIPAYRFGFVLRRAQELVDRLSQLGNDLLLAFDRRDAEALSLLQSRYEGVILGLTRSIKEDQVAAARANLAELAASETAARNRQTHYQQLLDQGLTPMEQAQIRLMISASVANDVAAGLKLASGIAHAFPESHIGLFIAGIDEGGEEAGSSLAQFADFSQMLGAGLSGTAEVLGVYANQQRMAQDWQLQLSTANSDLEQILQQTQAATHQLAIAQRDLEIVQQQITQNESITAFMRDKFANAQLYDWMSGQLSGLYLQAYQMAYDMAKSAERAFQFERAVGDGDVSFIRPIYWDSRRNGLLAGETLGIDLQRMANAYATTDGGGLEITKRISLAELDPVALLHLKSTGTCEFTLTEAHFDYDFPGHYRRQIRWLSVDFVSADGEPTTPNAVLTQLNHRTVLQPDTAAVKYLLDPKGSAPAALRSDVRVGRQIALSQTAQGEENSGQFQLNLDDDRYLPFEGTGAVSGWRLELTGRRSVDDPARLGDVVLTLRYTADAVDGAFANTVKSMLKPYPAFRYVDVATEFPDAWAEFLDGDGNELALPFSADMFPSMASRQITTIYSRFDVADGSSVSLVLNGNPDWTLDDGQVLTTNRLSVSSMGADWRFALTGDKTALANINLALGYKANVE